MSKIFEALSSVQTTVVKSAQDLPAALQETRMPESKTHWRQRNYPKFTEFKIDQFLDYLLSLHAQSEGSTYGIVPVTASTSIPRIVLETCMRLSENCDSKALLTDLSYDRFILEMLERSNSIDQPYFSTESEKVLPVLQDLFHFLHIPSAPRPSQNRKKIYGPEMMNLTSRYGFSLFLLPLITKFNIECIQLARGIENVILLCPTGGEDNLDGTSRFFSKLGVNVKGVYIIE